MVTLRLRGRLFPVVLFSGLLMIPNLLSAQEIPLEHCDSLPVIQVTASGRPVHFLVDTAATTMLNLESFASGTAKDISVTSWSGTLATSAKEVTLSELEIGRTKFARLKLPAIDLSAIGKACGKQIDGILGVDILKRLGANIDLKQHTLHVVTSDEANDAERVAAMQRDMRGCVTAFNDSDEKAFGDCLDEKIAISAADAQLFGREQVLRYFREKYFHQKPAARLDIRESSFHLIGQAVWYEYEFTIDSLRGRLHGRGMAMCKESAGHWRMASMHHSEVQFDQSAAATSGANR
jgi:hypothetical protein